MRMMKSETGKRIEVGQFNYSEAVSCFLSVRTLAPKYLQRLWGELDF